MRIKCGSYYSTAKVRCLKGSQEEAVSQIQEAEKWSEILLSAFAPHAL
jgi:hypothetical protein